MKSEYPRPQFQGIAHAEVCNRFNVDKEIQRSSLARDLLSYTDFAFTMQLYGHTLETQAFESRSNLADLFLGEETALKRYDN